MASVPQEGSRPQQRSSMHAGWGGAVLSAHGIWTAVLPRVVGNYKKASTGRDEGQEGGGP